MRRSMLCPIIIRKRCMKMEKYEVPDMEIIELQVADIITNSDDEGPIIKPTSILE